MSRAAVVLVQAVVPDVHESGAILGLARQGSALQVLEYPRSTRVRSSYTRTIQQYHTSSQDSSVNRFGHSLQRLHRYIPAVTQTFCAQCMSRLDLEVLEYSAVMSSHESAAQELSNVLETSRHTSPSTVVLQRVSATNIFRVYEEDPAIARRALIQASQWSREERCKLHFRGSELFTTTLELLHTEEDHALLESVLRLVGNTVADNGSFRDRRFTA